MRNKPMSMVTSNTMSVKSIARVEGKVFSKLSTVQVSISIDQVERTYGCQICLAYPRQSKLKIHLYDTYSIGHITTFTEHSLIICRRYLP